ncbi:MAG: hypothetical protein RJA10_4004 [Pseudomonadota bacterium]|jgi:exodeoxyribonuclease V beta subunit
MTDALNPLALPLQGSHLIEASAGTGKTWTIAALYLRLVLGHGCAPRHPREILVMTFTKAATRELSDRIRRRLVEAAAVFRQPSGTTDDPFLQGVLGAFADGPERQQAAWRLASAAEAMDDAAVHTIDAWCQRMLREHAFDSGSLFDEELQAQEAALLAEAVRDYWREQVYPLDDGTLLGVMARWKDVTALAADVGPLVGQPLPAQAGQGSLAEAAARAGHRHASALAALKSGWEQRAVDMLDWLSAIWADKQHPARKVVPAQAHATRWIGDLRAWALNPELEAPPLTKASVERLSARNLAAQLAALGLPAKLPEGFSAHDSLSAQWQGLPRPDSALRLHAAARVYERVQTLKARAGRFGFADLLNRLDQALDEAGKGPQALRLRERILQQHPVALIDEFQDTSPVQLRIFDRLYRIEENDPSLALLLIGDPKQAIYRFRGADIYSYLWARRATEGRHHVLDTNHRSTNELVAAVNGLFSGAETRPGEGAFRFRQPGAPSQLPFEPVRAKGRADRLVTSAGPLAAMTLEADEPLRNKDDSRRLFAALCAERIVTLLNDPGAGFEQPGQAFRRLQPADIAVLVRSGKEAEAVRGEMRRRGLASVYLSDKGTVFQTSEAADLLRLLQAVAAPRDIRLARAALATAMLGFSVAELVRLASDDQAFDRQAETLAHLLQVWRSQGVLSMVRQALHAFGLPARWLAAPEAAGSGERRLTNLLHLAELLQAASVQTQGEHALVRWLMQQLADSDQGLHGGDELVLRLESDADLVKVVTVHKSKGLEYPLVFLPFAAHGREVIGPGQSLRNAVFLLPDDDAVRPKQALVLGPNEAQRALEEREQHREQLRLLYVAVTRARHALWVGLSGLHAGRAQKPLWHGSAVGYLLSGDHEQPPRQHVLDAQALAGRCPGVQVRVLVDADPFQPPLTRLHLRGGQPDLSSSPSYSARFERDWSINSYSAMVRDATAPGPGPGTVNAHVEQVDEPDEADPHEGTAWQPRPAALPWHRFPRGALAGNFLHDQLEWLAGEGFALAASTDLQQRLQRRCERQGWSNRVDDLLAWLIPVCSTPLPALGVALADLRNPWPEMEFWFPGDGLDARQVDLLCRQHIQPGLPRPPLPARTLKGLFMGFADLVFEHEGRFWVLDYKSNALGHRDSDYTADAMNAAMLEHRYDVQAALYLLALHRLLRARLGAAYDPARQLGGAVYFFLRGIAGPAAGCCAWTAPQALVESLDAVMRLAPSTAAPGAA